MQEAAVSLAPLDPRTSFAYAANTFAPGPSSRFVALRDKQRPPPGEWLVWLVLAGRGWGKTITGAEWLVDEAVRTSFSRWAIVAPTFADGRDTCVEGATGVVASLERRRLRFTWNRSLGEVRLENGSLMKTFSAEQPERLRGPQHHGAWCDEPGSFPYGPEVWSNLQLGLRLGPHPQTLVTGTPRPVWLVKELVNRAHAEPDRVVITRGNTLENAANLPEAQLAALQDRYAGTRLGRQELEGELLDDLEGALWKRDWIKRASDHPDLRIVVGVDPSAWGPDDGIDNHTLGHGTETGIVVAGIARGNDRFKNVYVLEDRSARVGPDEWGKSAVAAYRQWGASAIVPETNMGGAMAVNTIRAAAQDGGEPVIIDPVRAAVGKRARAEPVAALYEQGRVFHVGSFEVLEDQMTEWDPSENWSPDRIDALVWAITKLEPWAGGPARSSAQQVASATFRTAQTQRGGGGRELASQRRRGT